MNLLMSKIFGNYSQPQIFFSSLISNIPGDFLYIFFLVKVKETKCKGQCESEYSRLGSHSALGLPGKCRLSWEWLAPSWTHSVALVAPRHRLDRLCLSTLRLGSELTSPMSLRPCCHSVLGREGRSGGTCLSHYYGCMWSYVYFISVRVDRAIHLAVKKTYEQKCKSHRK